MMINQGLALAALLGLLTWAGASWAGPSHGHIIDYIDGKIAAQPERADLYLRRAHLYAEIKHWRDAFADLDKAEQLGLAAQADVARGDFLSRRQQWAKALVVLDKVLAANPDHPDALLLRSKALDASGKPQAAMASYLHLAEVKPDMGIGQYRKLAQLLAQHRSHEQAIALLERRMAQVGVVPQLQQLAIELDTSAQRYESAIRRLHTMAAFSQSSPKWQLNLAELHWANGNRDAAAEYLAHAQQLLSRARQTRASQRLLADAQRLEEAMRKAQG